MLKLTMKRRLQRIAARRVLAVAVRCEATQLEAGLARSDQVQHAAGRQAAEHLRNDTGLPISTSRP